MTELVDKLLSGAQEPVSSFVNIDVVSKYILRVATRKVLCAGKKLTFILVLNSLKAAFPNSLWMN